jgi:hypothetical protein
MIQRQQSHPAGTFAACSSCKREPRHFIAAGSCSREPIDVRAGGPGERHTLECSRCGRTTARHASLPAAINEWGAAYAQGALELRAVSSRRRVA